MVKKAFFPFAFALFFIVSSAFSQELKCNVQVLSQKLQTADAKIFKTLEGSIFEFMNNRTWTGDNFKNEEKIECSIFINVTEEMGVDKFRAQVNIQSSRPVFNSSYNTVMFNYADKDWVFNYTEFQPLDFNENGFVSNLTSMLAFYAYVMIGLDYDSYSLYGGTPYYLKAQTLINNVPGSLSSDDAPGWKPFDGDKNRYWLLENILSPRYQPIREALYKYHIQGIDKMYEKPNEARQAILNSIRTMESIAEEYPNAMFLKAFFDAKSEEIISLFSAAPPSEKAMVVQLLYKSDPGNSSRYSKIMK